MCRLETTTLTPEPASAGEARRWVTDLLNRWDLAAVVDDLRLVVSELVSNAVLHARTAVEVVLSVGEGVIELAVRDRNPRTPRPRVANRGAEAAGGRGLLLVQELSDDWGVSERMDGKDVWFRVAAPEGWRYANACVCSDKPAETDERRTSSGARVIVMDPRALPGTP
ncbi:MAG TPA: ATP-binding protein [Mycobacteriales bacterium]|nr:ATP-binding protein [Mycobacteriales bacterium]